MHHPFADFHRGVYCIHTHTRTRSFSHMLTRLPNNIPVQNSALQYISIIICIILLLHLLLYASRVSIAVQKINIYTIFNFTEKKK